LESIGKPPDARAETLSPDEFVRFAEALAEREEAT
jgi:16S rRNA A1518/A1519 N6-dimethyltransferase RsmA/KsgA/DIM1 with predicted DNA glycosylase/AP lyase activity